MQEPWQQYCVEPPCGQMNIINENLYPVLRKILEEYREVFKPELFHIGGDEVGYSLNLGVPFFIELAPLDGARF